MNHEKKYCLLSFINNYASYFYIYPGRPHLHDLSELLEQSETSDTITCPNHTTRKVPLQILVSLTTKLFLRACCIKLTVDGKFAINGNYHGNRAQQPIKIKVSMVVTIDGKVTINSKFCAAGPSSFKNYIDD